MDINIPNLLLLQDPAVQFALRGDNALLLARAVQAARRERIEQLERIERAEQLYPPFVDEEENPTTLAA